MTAIGVKIASSHRVAQPWWPWGATFAADFIRDRYMRGGGHTARSSALTFARGSEGWAQDSAGTVIAFGENQMRITDRGLLVEGARTRLSLAPLGPGASPWTSLGAQVLAILEPEGAFTAPCRIASDGTTYARRISTAMTLAAGQPVRIKLRYRAGTSSRFGFYLQTGSANSLFEGPVGSLIPNSTTAGSWANPINVGLGGRLYEVETDFTPASNAADWTLGISPRSAIYGQYVDVLGAMIANGAGSTGWILGEAGGQFTRQADEIILHLPEGAHDVTFTFADAGDQTLHAVEGNLSVPSETLAGRIVEAIVAVNSQ